MRAIIIKLLQNIGGISLLAFALLMVSCQSGQDVYLYEVNEVEVSQSGVEKNNPKADLEFISLEDNQISSVSKQFFHQF